MLEGEAEVAVKDVLKSGLALGVCRGVVVLEQTVSGLNLPELGGVGILLLELIEVFLLLWCEVFGSLTAEAVEEVQVVVDVRARHELEDGLLPLVFSLGQQILLIGLAFLIG